MVRQFQPLDVCLSELRALIAQGASGSFYLADPANQVAAITLSNGVIEAVNFQGRRGEAAAELLKGLRSAVCTFRAEAARAASPAALSEPTLDWLRGSARQPNRAVAPSPASPVAPAKSNDRAQLEKYRQVVESIAFGFVGPVASALCEGAFAGCSSLEQVLDELAASLPPEEAITFRSAVAKAIAGK